MKIKKRDYKRELIFLYIMVIAGGIFTLLFLSYFGNTDQKYKDVIYEWNSFFSSNKSIEMILLYILIFGGSISYFLFFVLTSEIDEKSIEKINEEKIVQMVILTIVFLSATYFFVRSNINAILLGMLFLSLVFFIIEQRLVIPGICFYILFIYSIIALYRIFVEFGCEQSLHINLIVLISILSSIIILHCSKERYVFFIKSILILQVIIPFIFLIFLSNKYKLGEEIKKVEVPIQVKILIFLLIIISVFEAIFFGVKKWNTKNINDIFSYGTCVTLMTFNRFGSLGVIMSTDMHHPFENIIGFSQIFELGQKPFSEYIPTSGLYSIIQGLVFKVFGNGEFANYNITEEIFYLLIILILVAILKVNINRLFMFSVSILFSVINYNRLAFLLPIILILISPKLVKNADNWLKVWVLASLFQGLYYPLYGVAICVAFIPMAFMQFVNLFYLGEFRKIYKKPLFWFTWGACLLLIIFTTPLLLGTYRHMKAMSDQSMLADGISRFGQIPSLSFASYLNNYLGIKVSMLNILTWMVPVLMVWMSVVLTLKVSNFSIHGRKIIIKNANVACSIIAVSIVSVISYIYTFVRLDPYEIYNRSYGVIMANIVILWVIFAQYIRSMKAWKILIFNTLLILSLGGNVGICSNSEEMYAYYTVPDRYIYITNNEIEKLGTGYIERDLYNYIQMANESFQKLDMNASYFELPLQIKIPSQFGYFYLLGIKGSATIEGYTIKGKKAAKETMEVLKKNGTIVGGTISPLYNYYLYNWILTSGEYVWEVENGLFEPNNARYSFREVMEKNKNTNISLDNFDLKKNAASLGLSMDSLNSNFIHMMKEYIIQNDGYIKKLNFLNSFDGEEIDYVYIEFDNMEESYQYTLFDLNGEIVQDYKGYANYFMKKQYNDGIQVNIIWADENGGEHNLLCSMYKGKLLIPLGVGKNWLLNQHDYLKICVLENGKEIEMPDITNIEFLKLKEIE